MLLLNHLLEPIDPGSLGAGLLPTLTLPFALRRRSRQKVQLDDGTDAGLLLPKGTVLRENDRVAADNGRQVRILAAPEDVLQVRAGTALALMRAAYHLGNRHVSLEISPYLLQLEFDAVLQDMLDRLPGLSTRRAMAPFHPESGAYGGGHKHGHDETFGEDYALAQAAFQAHEHPASHGHEHSHDHGHVHAHGHPHARQAPAEPVAAGS